MGSNLYGFCWRTSHKNDGTCTLPRGVSYHFDVPPVDFDRQARDYATNYCNRTIASSPKLSFVIFWTRSQYSHFIAIPYELLIWRFAPFTLYCCAAAICHDNLRPGTLQSYIQYRPWGVLATAIVVQHHNYTFTVWRISFLTRYYDYYMIIADKRNTIGIDTLLHGNYIQFGSSPFE